MIKINLIPPEYIERINRKAVIAKAGPLYLGTLHDRTAAAKKATFLRLCDK